MPEKTREQFTIRLRIGFLILVEKNDQPRIGPVAYGCEILRQALGDVGRDFGDRAAKAIRDIAASRLFDCRCQAAHEMIQVPVAAIERQPGDRPFHVAGHRPPLAEKRCLSRSGGATNYRQLLEKGRLGEITQQGLTYDAVAHEWPRRKTVRKRRIGKTGRRVGGKRVSIRHDVFLTEFCR